jgi:hypothetical protein
MAGGRARRLLFLPASLATVNPVQLLAPAAESLQERPELAADEFKSDPERAKEHALDRVRAIGILRELGWMTIRRSANLVSKPNASAFTAVKETEFRATVHTPPRARDPRDPLPHPVTGTTDEAAAPKSPSGSFSLDRTAGAGSGPWDDESHAAGAIIAVNRAEALT